MQENMLSKTIQEIMAINTRLFIITKNNEPKSPINQKTFSKHSFFSNQLNAENISMVKSVDIKPFF